MKIKDTNMSVLPNLQGGNYTGKSEYDLAKETAEIWVTRSKDGFDVYEAGGGGGFAGGSFSGGSASGGAVVEPGTDEPQGGGYQEQEITIDDESLRWWNDNHQTTQEASKVLLYAAIAIGIYSIIKK